MTLPLRAGRPPPAVAVLTAVLAPAVVARAWLVVNVTPGLTEMPPRRRRRYPQAAQQPGERRPLPRETDHHVGTKPVSRGRRECRTGRSGQAAGQGTPCTRGTPR